jgi:long-chain acyl-CoA synthetase
MDAKEIYAAKPWVAHYPDGVAEGVDVPDMSVPQAFDKMADQYAGKNALIFYGKKITYRKLKELTDRFAAALSTWA